MVQTIAMDNVEVDWSPERSAAAHARFKEVVGPRIWPTQGGRAGNLGYRWEHEGTGFERTTVLHVTLEDEGSKEYFLVNDAGELCEYGSREPRPDKADEFAALVEVQRDEPEQLSGHWFGEDYGR